MTTTIISLRGISLAFLACVALTTACRGTDAESNVEDSPSDDGIVCAPWSNLPDMDWDRDGLPNRLDPDDDNDTVPDSEVPADFRRMDWDNDGLTNESDDDDDGDTVLDDEEFLLGGDGCVFVDTDEDTNPDRFDTDSDADTVCDGLEKRLGTDGRRPDTDGDTVSDFWEIVCGGNPLDPLVGPVEQALIVVAGTDWPTENACWQYSASSLAVDLPTTESVPTAEVRVHDAGPALEGHVGSDYLGALTVTEVIPGSAGTIVGERRIDGLQSGAVVRVEAMGAFRFDRCSACDRGHLLEVQLVETAADTVLGSQDFCLVVNMHFGPTGEQPPSNECGLFAECPRTSW